MARLSQADLIELNRAFESRTPPELVTWAKSIFGKRVAAISAMQKSGSVISHMLHALKTGISVLFVDTGVMYSETLATRDRIAKEYGLDIITLEPVLTMQQQTEQFGVLYLSPEGQKQCCDMRKIQPLGQIKGRYDALISSLRRSDGGRRSDCPILAVDSALNCIRINPLANATDEFLSQYIDEHSVIINPLHSQGFETISCNRCTTPVLPNEPKRAGRWRHLGPWSVYCGINPTDLDAETAPAVEFSQELIDRILGRATDFVI